MNRAPPTCTVRGTQLADLQYFLWKHTTELQYIFAEGGGCTPGPRVPLCVTELCYSCGGVVYYDANDGIAPKTLAEIDAAPNSEIEALDRFRDKRPTY